MKLIGILFLLVGIVLTAFAQQTGSISGEVLFEGKPVEDATIKVFTGGNSTPLFETKTDSHGRFTIAKVPPGTYSVRASYEFKITQHGRSHAEFGEWSEDVVVVEGDDTNISAALKITTLGSTYQVQEHVEISVDLNQPDEQKQHALPVYLI